MFLWKLLSFSTINNQTNSIQLVARQKVLESPLLFRFSWQSSRQILTEERPGCSPWCSACSTCSTGPTTWSSRLRTPGRGIRNYYYLPTTAVVVPRWKCYKTSPLQGSDIGENLPYTKTAMRWFTMKEML